MRLSLTPIITTLQKIEFRLDLQVHDGVTNTVFPMSERWLRADSDRQMAVQHIKGRHKAERFRSLMDYLFANVFSGTSRLVYDFYEEKGPQLCKIVTHEQCFKLDSYLQEALEIAYEAHCAERKRSWSQVKRKVKQIVCLIAA